MGKLKLKSLQRAPYERQYGSEGRSTSETEPRSGDSMYEFDVMYITNFTMTPQLKM